MTYDFDTPAERRGTGSYKWDLPGQPGDVLPFWVADMDFPAPPGVAKALTDRAAQGVFGYTFVPESIFEAFMNWQKKRNGLAVERDWLLYLPGVVSSLHMAIEAFTKEGEGVVIQTPVYRPFFKAVEVLGRRLVLNPLVSDDGAYRMDYRRLEEAMDEGVKLLILCSPHNPVGRVWSREELGRLSEICLRKGVVVACDEIHSDLILPGNRFFPILALGGKAAANTVVTTAPSKTFNIPGAGCAILTIPDAGLREAFTKAANRAYALDLPNIFSVTAALAAYETGEEWLEALLPYLAENYAFLKDFFASRLPAVKVCPLEGTYVVWLDFRAFGLSPEALGKLLLEEAAVKLSDGPGFGPGGEGFERFNIACSRRTLQEGLERIASAFERRGLA